MLGLILVLLTIISMTIIIWLLHSQIMRPIRALSDAVVRISLGDLSQKVVVNSHDELGALGESFNHMTEQLASAHLKLEATTQLAREKSAELQSSINGLRQGFLIIGLQNEVLLANTAALAIINKSAAHGHASTHKQIVLDDVARVLPPDFDVKEAIAEALKNRKLSKFPSLPLHGRFLNIYLSPVISGSEAIGCVLLLEDVTEERILERSRDEFFSIASHELRTPLTAIRGNAAMIQQYYPEAIADPAVKEMVTDMHDAATRLIEIVNDFLSTSSLEQNKMKFSFTAFALDKTIEKVIYEMSNISREKHITLDFDHNTLDKLPYVYADPSRVTQILYNLVGNAMKFTDKGSVTINCLVEGKFIKVCVSDTGQGVSPEGQQLLFHKFQQSTSSILTRDNTRGTGLGLYISKLLIEHMGGAIRLEHSDINKGSVFSFTVPIATKTQIAKAQDKPASQLRVTAKQAQ
jgi:two-component system, OmpR family, sensor histidine kinase ResE